MSGKFAILLIILLGAALRLITLPNLMIFTSDEMYQSYIAQTIIKDFHVIWIGTSVLGFDLYLGPFWIYIISFFLIISHGDPAILGYITAILGLLAIFLLYWLGKRLLDEKNALAAALLFSTSPLVIYNEQKPYPPGVPFLSLLMALSIYMFKHSPWWLVFFAALFGLMFHIHLSPILIIFVALYWVFLHRKLINRKFILLSVITFLLMVSPLLAFDYFHKASNITVPLRILKSIQKSESRSEVGHHLEALAGTFGRAFYLAPYRNNSDEILYPCSFTDFSTRTKPNFLLSFLIVGLFAFFATRKDTWKDDKKRLIMMVSLAFLVPFILLPSINPIEYYLVGFFPLLFLISSFVALSLKGSLRLPAWVAIIIIAVLGSFTVITAKGDYGLNAKKKLITQVMEVIGNDPYELKHEGVCHKWEGWRYLFSVFGRRPEKSSDDEIYAWLYPNEVSNKPTRYSVILAETRNPMLSDQGYKFKLEEGGFSAFIFEN